MADVQLDIRPSGAPIGAAVRGVDLTRPLTDAEVAAIRAAWLEHQVLAFPDQPMSDDDLERFTLHFGPFGEDPFFAAIEGRNHIAAIRRGANETSPLFAENWHADWTFQEFGPDGTCLHSRIVPPVGGNTEFVDQYAVYDALPDDLRAWADSTEVWHSARGGYAPDGLYGEDDPDDRSMAIRPSSAAYAMQRHPLVRVHPETGRRTLYSCLGYIIGVADPADGRRFIPADEAATVQLDHGRLGEIYGAQHDERFRYSHVWEPDMLLMWDNRCVLHRATGGYDGHERLLHRTTIGYNADVR